MRSDGVARARYLDKLGVCMDDSTKPSAQQIHEALERVSELRELRATDPSLVRASAAVKRFQALRFKATYADLLVHPRYQQAAGFFLEELYSDKDYVERDQQFARIANAMARLFPKAVAQTAAALAQVHALTEMLDDRMARAWAREAGHAGGSADCGRYVRCWRQVGDEAGRLRQLEVVLHLGRELERLTRKPGLRGLLKMMRRPAEAAGLSSLQRFLESGFDAFVAIRGAGEFLQIIDDREQAWIRSLFADDAVTCETRLMHLVTAAAAH